MKKITLILMVVLTITGCKKEKVDKPASSSVIASTAPKQDSIYFDSFYTQRNIENKVNWLKKNGKLVYKQKLKDAVLTDHKLNATVTYQTGKYIKTWGELKKMIRASRYEIYLDVAYKKRKITGINVVKDYMPGKDSITYRFSPVLIRSLGEEYAEKNDNAEFQFSFATKQETNKKTLDTVIVIQVNANPGNKKTVEGSPYYDYSNDPKKKYLLTRNLPL